MQLHVLQKHIDSAKRLKSLNLDREGEQLGYMPTRCCPEALAGLEFDPRVDSWGVVLDIIEDDDLAETWANDFDNDEDVQPVSFKLKENWETYL
jgi:hypothetical protein